MKKLFTIFLLLAIIGLSSAYTQKINIDSGLVAYFPFNGNGNDTSGNGNNGTPSVPGPTLTTDRFGVADKAYSFDGNEDNYIMLSPFVPPQIISISIWFNPVTDGGPGGDHMSVLFSNVQKYVGHDGIGISIYNGKIQFGILNSTTQNFIILSNSLINLNHWHHLVCIIDNDKNMKMFLDNVYQNQTIIWSGTYNGQNMTNIGNNVQDNDSFDGALDDVRIYNRALSESEIQALYHEGGWVGIPSSRSANFKIEIYPNPTNEKVYIKSEKNLEIKVYNMSGELIFSGNSNDRNYVTLVQKGLYLFELTSDKNIIYKKVVVQ